VIFCSEEKAQSSLEKFHHKQPSSELGGSLPDASSYWEGWVHFYHYSTGPEIKRPRLFFQNNEFFAQRVPLGHVKKSDGHGSLIIPNKSSFFAVLSPKALQLYSGRDDSIKKQVDFLEYSYIGMIPEDEYLKGAIKDMGAFNVGYCVEIKADLPNGRGVGDTSNVLNTTWILCFEKEKDKAKFLKTIVKLRLKEQRKNGAFKTHQALLKEKRSNTASELLRQAAEVPPADDKSETKVKSPRDGYWILLQNWTDCTLKCGGGESFQQWQCVPARDGGKPCQGKSIKVRKCNLQACPGVSSLLNMMKLAEPEVAKPIVKVGPFSERLQRYSKCIIKENDVFVTTTDAKSQTENKLPARAVMNNRTLTIYKDDYYQDIEYTYVLKKTTFIALQNEFCCFKLQDSMRSLKICGYEKNCGDPDKNQWVNQWGNDFTLFKVDCHVGRQTSLLSADDEKQLAEDLKKKLGQARLDVLGDKQKKLRLSMMSSQNGKYKLKVKKVQDTGFKAIEKELQLENLIRQEEKAKEEMELNNLLKLIQAEKDKQACLRNTIKERDLDAEFLDERRSSEHEVAEIKEEISKQVKIKRAKMKKLIEQMRAKTRLRKSALENELKTLRQTMAKEMLQANKSGSMEKCRAGKTDMDKREIYCNLNYIEDYVRNSDCKTDENFCYMCCEKEFGNMFIDRRENCYNMCDLNVAKAVRPKTGNGPWMWTPKVGK
jgi:hypothetical protein